MRWGGLLVCLWLVTVAAAAAAAEGRLGTETWPSLRLPYDLAVAEGGVYVVEDRAGRLLRLREGGRQEELGFLGRPKVVAADPSGLVIALHRPPDGGWRLAGIRGNRAEFDVALRGDALPENPVAVAAGDGIVWVLENRPPRLLLYAYDGASLGWVAIDRWARSPFSLTLGAAGEAFVTDPMGPAVLGFSPAGAYLGPVPLADTGITRPTGIAADPAGHLWVSDGVTGAIHCVDASSSEPRLHCGGVPARFEDPLRLTWGRGALWVLQGRLGKIQRIDLE